MSQDKATPEEEKRFQQEVDLDKDLRERYKREALKKCAAEHLAYIECLDKGKTCVKEDKAFWDCYRAQRGYSKTKFDVMMERMNRKWFPNFHNNQGQNGAKDQTNPKNEEK